MVPDADTDASAAPASGCCSGVGEDGAEGVDDLRERSEKRFCRVGDENGSGLGDVLPSAGDVEVSLTGEDVPELDLPRFSRLSLRPNALPSSDILRPMSEREVIRLRFSAVSGVDDSGRATSVDARDEREEGKGIVDGGCSTGAATASSSRARCAGDSAGVGMVDVVRGRGIEVWTGELGVGGVEVLEEGVVRLSADEMVMSRMLEVAEIGTSSSAAGSAGALATAPASADSWTEG